MSRLVWRQQRINLRAFHFIWSCWSISLSATRTLDKFILFGHPNDRPSLANSTTITEQMRFCSSDLEGNFSLFCSLCNKSVGIGTGGGERIFERMPHGDKCGRGKAFVHTQVQGDVSEIYRFGAGLQKLLFKMNLVQFLSSFYSWN